MAPRMERRVSPLRIVRGSLPLTVLLLLGCEDNKLITPPPAEVPAQPTPAATPPRPSQHSATGVGGTKPVAELPPAKAASDWGAKNGSDAGTASDAGASQPRVGPPPGDSRGPAHP
jgi:hypothetical protein